MGSGYWQKDKSPRCSGWKLSEALHAVAVGQAESQRLGAFCLICPQPPGPFPGMS